MNSGQPPAIHLTPCHARRGWEVRQKPLCPHERALESPAHEPLLVKNHTESVGGGAVGAFGADGGQAGVGVGQHPLGGDCGEGPGAPAGAADKDICPITVRSVAVLSPERKRTDTTTGVAVNARDGVTASPTTQVRRECDGVLGIRHHHRRWVWGLPPATRTTPAPSALRRSARWRPASTLVLTSRRRSTAHSTRGRAERQNSEPPRPARSDHVRRTHQAPPLAVDDRTDGPLPMRPPRRTLRLQHRHGGRYLLDHDRRLR